MKTTKTFSIEIDDLIKFEEWRKAKAIENHSKAFRVLLKTAGVIE